MAPRSDEGFDPSHHQCQGDFVVAPPGLLLIIRYTKSMQVVGKAPFLPIPEVIGHPADPVAAYKDIRLPMPTMSPNKPFLTVTRMGKKAIVTVDTLTRALKVMLDALGVEKTYALLYSLDSPAGH